MPGCGCSTSPTRLRCTRSRISPEKMVDPRPNRPRVTQSNDVHVAPDGLICVTDINDGLTILQYKG
jgi:hypothetical protein